jgi:hypothetical protein
VYFAIITPPTKQSIRQRREILTDFIGFAVCTRQHKLGNPSFLFSDVNQELRNQANHINLKE